QVASVPRMCLALAHSSVFQCNSEPNTKRAAGSIPLSSSCGDSYSIGRLVGFLGSGAVYPGQMCGSQTSPLDVHFLLGPRGSTVSGRQIQPKTIAYTSNVLSVGAA